MIARRARNGRKRRAVEDDRVSVLLRLDLRALELGDAEDFRDLRPRRLGLAGPGDRPISTPRLGGRRDGAQRRRLRRVIGVEPSPADALAREDAILDEPP